MSQKSSVLYTVALFCAAALLALVVPGANDSVLAPGEVVAANPAVMPQLTGSWSGSWTDTVYNATGALSFVIWPEGNSYAATGTIDVSTLGLSPLNGTATGTDNGTTVTGTFTCASLGDGSFTLTPVKNIGGVLVASGTGSGTVTAPLNFGAFTLTGTATDTDITGAFDFTSPGGGKGVAILSKTSTPVAAESWGSLKAEYRAD